MAAEDQQEVQPGPAVTGQEMQFYDPQRVPDLASLDYDGLKEFIRESLRVVNGFQWLAGDAAGLVEVRYGEGKLQQLAADLGMEYGTLLNYRTVAGAYPQSSRRGELSWSVYRELAAHPRRIEVVTSGGSLTVAEARRLMEDYRLGEKPASGPSPRPPSARNLTIKARVEQELRPVRQELEQVRQERDDFEQELSELTLSRRMAEEAAGEDGTTAPSKACSDPTCVKRDQLLADLKKEVGELEERAATWERQARESNKVAAAWKHSADEWEAANRDFRRQAREHMEQHHQPQAREEEAAAEEKQ